MAEIHAKKIDEKKFSSLLQKDLLIKGEVHFPDDTLVKGKILGVLDCRAEVIIGKNAEIRGKIKADRLQIWGNIVGDILCDHAVIIEKSARVTGDISAPNLNIEPGSFFEGRSIMNSRLKEHS